MFSYIDPSAIAYIFGSLVVFLFCIKYFNEPKYSFTNEFEPDSDDPDSLLEPALPQYMTNQYQYKANLVLFIIVTEILFVALSKLLPLLPGTGFTKGETTVSFTLSSALIISGFAPNFPMVEHFINQAKQYLHKRAQIPRKGQEIYRYLRNNEPEYSDSTIGEMLEKKLFSETIRRENFNDSSTTLKGRWIKISWILWHGILYSSRKVQSGPFSA